MSERTFKVTMKREQWAEVTLTEDEARELFPEAGWDLTETSHAGNMEDLASEDLSEDLFHKFIDHHENESITITIEEN